MYVAVTVVAAIGVKLFVCPFCPVGVETVDCHTYCFPGVIEGTIELNVYVIDEAVVDVSPL